MFNVAAPSRRGVGPSVPSRLPKTTDAYLRDLLARERIASGPDGPLAPVNRVLGPEIRAWAGRSLAALTPSGSFAKGTANHSGTDLDLLVAIAADAPAPIADVYESLFTWLESSGFSPTRQTATINVVIDGFAVDLIPAKQDGLTGDDVLVYRQRAGVAVRTNLRRHLHHVAATGRESEIRILKLWRDQQQLHFPSLCLEVAVIAALGGVMGGLSDNLWRVFTYLHERFDMARLVDPGNAYNVLSDEFTMDERRQLSVAVERTLRMTYWSEIVE